MENAIIHSNVSTVVVFLFALGAITGTTWICILAALSLAIWVVVTVFLVKVS